MNTDLYSKPTEVSKSDPCPICGKPDWCCWLPDGAVVCGRVDIPPDGWLKAGKHAKDGRNIFQPVRNRAVPRPNRPLPGWRRTGKHDGPEFEKEIIFQYSETQRVIRKQWSDRREVYENKRTGKFKSKLVIPQHCNGDLWEWGKGADVWPLYRIDEVRSSDVLFYVGGEICVDTMRKWGFSATCHQGGEGTYIDEVVSSLAQCRFLMLAIIPDNDKPGQKAAKKLFDAVTSAGMAASILEPASLNPDAPEKWDVADWEVDSEVAQLKISEAVSNLTVKLNDSVSVEPSSVEGLKRLATIYAQEQDPFAQAILAKEIGSEYGVRGKQLDDLARIAVKPEDYGNVPISENLIEVFDEITRRANGESAQGIPSGFIDLDAMTQGYQPGDLIILGARPSQGKTSAALAHAVEAARQGYQTHFFSLEMSKNQLTYRILSSALSVETGRLRAGQVEDWDAITRVMQVLSELPLIINDTPQMTVVEIRESLLRASDKPGIVFVDYLQLLEGPGQNDVSKYSNISRKLKALARDLEVPVVALSQLSRGVESRADKRPVMSDLRESGAIEQDADLIMMLYRDEYYNPDTPDRGVAELNIVKHRNGPTGTVKLLFEPKYTRFRNLLR